MKRKIGFIGLGEMGFRMAKRLIGDGYKLIVFDVVKEPLLNLRDAGAQVAESSKEVAENHKL